MSYTNVAIFVDQIITTDYIELNCFFFLYSLSILLFNVGRYVPEEHNFARVFLVNDK